MRFFKWVCIFAILAKSAEAQIGNLNSPGEPNVDMVAKEKKAQQAQDKKDSTPTSAEEESSIIDFQNIKNVLNS